MLVERKLQDKEVENILISRMTPTKQGDEDKKGCSTINEVVTREHTIHIPKCIHRVGYEKHYPRALRDPEIGHEGDETSR